MDPTNTTDLPACASQDGAHPPIALTADAGAQTGRPVITAVARGNGYSPDTVTLTVDGAKYVVSVMGDRDDWQFPEFDDAMTGLAAMNAIDAAYDRYVDDEDDGARASLCEVCS